MRSWNRSSLIALSLGIMACGDSGGSNGAAKRGGESYTAIRDALASPTGTVSASTAPEIGVEFEKVTGTSSTAKQKQASAQTQTCSGGGTISVTAEGDQNSATSVIDYDNCCESTCCTDGGGVWYFSTVQGSEYSYCGNYKLQISCETSETTSVQYEGCVGSSGTWVYVVRVGGETYAVTGSYYDGNGTLEVTGANGSFSCTYTDGSGSCTGTGGSFDF